MEITINKNDLLRFIKGIMLNGIINDVVIDVDANSKTMSASCVDEFSIVFLSGKVVVDSVKGENGFFGVRDLPLLYKVVDSLITQDTIILKCDKELRIGSSIKLAIAEKAEIKTHFQDKEGKLVELLKTYKDSDISISCKDLNNVMNHITVFTPDLLCISLSSKGVVLQPEENNANQFKINIESVAKNKKAKIGEKLNDTHIIVGCKYISAVLSYLITYCNDDEMQIKMIADKPLSIKCADFHWLLSPINTM